MSAELLRECRLLRQQIKADERGALVSVESGVSLPFEIKRVYYIFDVPLGEARGGHAHIGLHQWLVCVSGSCVVKVDDGHTQTDVLLNSPEEGLLVGPGVWREMREFAPGTVLVTFADAHYDESDYIRDYDMFLRTVKEA